jgi:hypothetical protein
VRALVVAVALLAGCGEGAPPPVKNEQPPIQAAVPEPAPAVNRAEPPPEAPDTSGLADMSPGQRRAYEAGVRDCAAGRYEPDRYPEAYRIGCAAVQDR